MPKSRSFPSLELHEAALAAAPASELTRTYGKLVKQHRKLLRTLDQLSAQYGIIVDRDGPHARVDAITVVARLEDLVREDGR